MLTLHSGILGAMAMLFTMCFLLPFVSSIPQNYHIFFDRLKLGYGVGQGDAGYGRGYGSAIEGYGLQHEGHRQGHPQSLCGVHSIRNGTCSGFACLTFCYRPSLL